MPLMLCLFFGSKFFVSKTKNNKVKRRIFILFKNTK